MGVKAAQDLYLDPAIRDWVLIPITLIMLISWILVGVLRHYVTMLLNSAPKKQPAAVVREQRALTRAYLLRSTAPLSPLPPATYRAFSTELAEGLSQGRWLKPKLDSDQEAEKNPFEQAGMEGAMDGMKKQAVMMVPNMVIMQYISVFFSGFILIRLPFPLTAGFKSLLSRDIVMPDLDAQWVSALSWYFLNLFGLNGVFKLLLGENAAVDMQSMQNMSLTAASAAPAAGPGAPDYAKLYRAEAENLALAEGVYKWVGQGVEDRVLALYGR